MSKNNKEDIQNIDYSYIGLISQKIKIGIIGAGKAGFIKASHFLRDNCTVEILSKSFSNEILNLNNKYSSLKLIKGKYDEKFLKDKHIIIAAVDNKNIIDSVKNFCRENFRIYINSVDFRDGMGIIPVEVKSSNIFTCVNTAKANPKGAVMISRKIKEIIDEYDNFIEYTAFLRNKAKKNEKYKKIIIDTIGNEEFKKHFDNKKSEIYLKEHLPEDAFKFLFENI